jgi:luciferase-like monooxygenase
MKFGLSVSVQHRSDEPSAERMREILEQVTLARDLGFDSISASQHYLAAPFQYFQPIPLLARIAAESGAMTLITNILLLPLYNPVDLAEQLATLQQQVQFYRETLQALGKLFPEDFPLSTDPDVCLEEGPRTAEELLSRPVLTLLEASQADLQ